MRTIRLTGFGFGLFCLFLANSIAAHQAPAQNQSTQSRKGYCKAWSSDQATIYFSDVFESDVPSSVILNRGIENLFEAHLKQSYGYSSTLVTPVVCVLGAQSVAVAEEGKKQEQAMHPMQGKHLVETRWKLSRQQAAALAAVPLGPQCYEHGNAESDPNCKQTVPSAAPAGAGSASTPSASGAANPNATRYEVCRAVTSMRTGGKYTTYFSGIMPRANLNEADYSAAFVTFLAKKYGVQGLNPDPSMCAMVPSEAEGQKLVEQGWWKVNPNFSTAVQTGWMYSPASSPEAPAPAAPSASVNSYTVCFASDASTAYVSAAFAVTAMDNPSWTKGFAQFLAQNYSYKGGGVGCNNMDAEHAPTFLKNRIAGLRANKKQVVETGWTYGSSATAATAAPGRPAQNVPAAAVPSTHAPITTPQSAPSKPSAPPSRYAYCYSTDGAHTAYFSAPFKVADGDSTKWRQAFAAFLQKNYHAAAPPGCYRHSSLADAQSDLKKLQGAFPPTSKIVETRWEYKE
jgi:hypothetical protein